jgi:hypothetical protein
MKRWIRWMFVAAGAIVLVLVSLGQHYVLNSAALNEAIQTEIPPGTPKGEVVAFVQKRHPVAYDDTAMQVKARLQGRAENIFYRKDIVITFDFSSDGNLLAYSTKEYLSFL